MKTADSFYSKYEFPLRRDRSSGVYTKDDLLEFAEAFATEHDQEIIKMIDEMIVKENSGEHLKTCSRLVTQALTELRSRL